MEIKSEEPVPAASVKKILSKREKEKELGYEQKITLEYLKKFSKVSEKDVLELSDELKKIEKLKPQQIINIVDFLPKDLDELRLIFANDRTTLSEDDKKKVLSLVKKVAK